MIKLLMVDDDRFYSKKSISNESVIFLGVPETDVQIARDYWSAQAFVLQQGIPSMLTMDNDIASFDENGNEFKGYDFVKWLCEQVLDNKLSFPDDFVFNAHTANIVDQKAMIGYLKNFFAQVLGKELKMFN